MASAGNSDEEDSREEYETECSNSGEQSGEDAKNSEDEESVHAYDDAVVLPISEPVGDDFVPIVCKYQVHQLFVQCING